MQSQPRHASHPLADRVWQRLPSGSAWHATVREYSFWPFQSGHPDRGRAASSCRILKEDLWDVLGGSFLLPPLPRQAASPSALLLDPSSGMSWAPQACFWVAQLCLLCHLCVWS